MIFPFRKKEKAPITAEDIQNNTNAFFTWIQSFSKIIVTITFFIFVIINIFIMLLIIFLFFKGEYGISIDTLITETNETFRNVIGGYIIKAAAENTLHIVMSTVEEYLKSKYKTEVDLNNDGKCGVTVEYGFETEGENNDVY